jgi:hypothetical protein
VIRERLIQFRYEILKAVFCRNTNGFINFELFRYKWQIHRHEWGHISDWRYLKLADWLFDQTALPASNTDIPSGDLENCNRPHDNARLGYYNPRNEVAILHGSMIGTCFRPIDGRAFFKGECGRAVR